MARDKKRSADRRTLKRAIAVAKRDPAVKALPKTRRKRAAAGLGRKTFRAKKAAEAAKPKPAAAGQGAGEAPKAE